MPREENNKPKVYPPDAAAAAGPGGEVVYSRPTEKERSTQYHVWEGEAFKTYITGILSGYEGDIFFRDMLAGEHEKFLTHHDDNKLSTVYFDLELFPRDLSEDAFSVLEARLVGATESEKQRKLTEWAKAIVLLALQKKETPLSSITKEELNEALQWLENAEKTLSIKCGKNADIEEAVEKSFTGASSGESDQSKRAAYVLMRRLCATHDQASPCLPKGYFTSDISNLKDFGIGLSFDGPFKVFKDLSKNSVSEVIDREAALTALDSKSKIPLGKIKYTLNMTRPPTLAEGKIEFESKALRDFYARSLDLTDTEKNQADQKFLHDIIIEAQKRDADWRPTVDDIKLLFDHAAKKNCFLDLSGIILPEIDIPPELLQGANLSNLNLSTYSFEDMDLSYSTLRGADLRGADLRGADLRGADLRGADLSGAILNDRFTHSSEEKTEERSTEELTNQLHSAEWNELFFEVTDPANGEKLGRIKIPRETFDHARIFGRGKNWFATMLYDLYSEQLKEDFARIAYTPEEKSNALVDYANLCRVLGKKCDFSKVAASKLEQEEFQARVRRVEIKPDEERPVVPAVAAASKDERDERQTSAVTIDSDIPERKISIEETEKRIKQTQSNYVFYRDIIAENTIVAGQLSFADFIKNNKGDNKIRTLLLQLKPADFPESDDNFLNNWTLVSLKFQHFAHAEDSIKKTVRALTILWLKNAFPELVSKTNEEMIKLLTSWEKHYIQDIASPTLTHVSNLSEPLIHQNLLLTTSPALTLTFKDGALHGAAHSVVSVKKLSTPGDPKKAISAQWSINILDDGVHLSCSNKSALFCIFEQCADRLDLLTEILNRDNPATDCSNLDLRGIDFSGANLSGANLSGANLSGATIDRKSRISAEQLKSAKWSSFNYAILDKEGKLLTTVVVNREEFEKTLKNGGDFQTFIYKLARAQVEYQLSDDYDVMHTPLTDNQKQDLLEKYNLICKIYDRKHDLSECKIAGDFTLVITSNTLPPKDVVGFTGKAVYQYRSRDGRGEPVKIEITKDFLNVIVMPASWQKKFDGLTGTDAAKILQIMHEVGHKGSHEEKRMLALAEYSTLRKHLLNSETITLDQAHILIDTAVRAGVTAESAVKDFQLEDKAVYTYKNQKGEVKEVKFIDKFGTNKADAISAVARARVSDEEALSLHKKMTSFHTALADPTSVLPEIKGNAQTTTLSSLRNEYLARKDATSERLPLPSLFNLSYTAAQKLKALDLAEWKIRQALENGTHVDFDSLPKPAKQGRLGDTLKKLVAEVNASIDAEKTSGPKP